MGKFIYPVNVTTTISVHTLMTYTNKPTRIFFFIDDEYKKVSEKTAKILKIKFTSGILITRYTDDVNI